MSLYTLPSNRLRHHDSLWSNQRGRRKKSRYQQVFSVKCVLRPKTQMIIEIMIYSAARWQCKYCAANNMTTLTHLCQFNNSVDYQHFIVFVISYNYSTKLCVCVYTSLHSTTSYIPYKTTAAARDGGDILQIVQHATSAQSLADQCHFFLLIVHKTQAAYVSREQRCKHTFHPSNFWRHSHILYFTTKLCMPFPVAVRSTAWVSGHLLVRIVDSKPAGGASVCCECCVMSGRGLCVGLITRPEDSYRM